MVDEENKTIPELIDGVAARTRKLETAVALVASDLRAMVRSMGKGDLRSRLARNADRLEGALNGEDVR